MATLRTPGVYVQEITKFPPSVAPVATAIPAFIGYTEKATKLVAGDLAMVPTRIKSMLEYERYFGFAQDEDSIEVEVNSDNKIIVTNDTPSDYLMYYSLQMYFANGGGPCYITSVGLYGDTISIGTSSTGLTGGLAAVRKEDEPTLLLFPDAKALSSVNFYALYNSALTQCNELQDRFTIIDTHESSDVLADMISFRNGIGSDKDFIKYGAAYYPYLETILDFFYDEGSVWVTDNSSISSAAQVEVLGASIYANTAALGAAIQAFMDKREDINSLTGTDPVLTVDRNEVDSLMQDLLNQLNSSLALFNQILALAQQETTPAVIAATNDLDAWVSANIEIPIAQINAQQDRLALASTATNANVVVIMSSSTATSSNTYSSLGLSSVAAGTAGTESYTDSQLYTELNVNPTAEITALVSAYPASTSTTQTLLALETSNNALYNRVKAAISDYPVTLPPSSAMAGIYARVDNAVGVWKAPANVTVTYVQKPTVQISMEDQGDMNVTSTGKSVNAIRTFNGKGTLVWGARTLAGNDNEWRYIPVRRFFNFVEESVSEASEQFVFEPNTANTWVRIRGMIENFLNQQWKAGALAGSKPEEAFYVRVGLGQTMTSQDILEGTMNIEIGMAVVRPAEFIVLKFSHKMQEA